MPCGTCGDNCKCSTAQCCQTCKCDASCSCKSGSAQTGPPKTTKQ